MGVPEKPRGGCGKIALIGCGGISILFVIAAFLLFLYWPSLVVMGIQYQSDAVLEHSNIDESVKESFRTQRDRLLAKYEAEEMENAELVEYLHILEDSPIIPGYLELVMEADVLPQTTLDEQQKADVMVQMNRIVRGFSDGELRADDIKGIIDPIVNVSGSANGAAPTAEVSTSIDDETLLKVAADLKVLSDGKNINSEHFDFDVTSALKDFVDEAMNKEADPKKSTDDVSL